MEPTRRAWSRRLAPCLALLVGGCFPTFTFPGEDGGGAASTEGMILLPKGPSQLEIRYGSDLRYLRLDSYRFYMDAYEVNVADFKAWAEGEPQMVLPEDGAILDAGPYKNVMVWRKQWDVAARSVAYRDSLRVGVGGRKSSDYLGGYETGSGGSNADPPAVDNVPWEQALAYCASRGARLPTLAEWLFAANTDLGVLPYPWGTTQPTCERALFSGEATVAPDAVVPRAGRCDPNRGTHDFPGGQTREGIHGLAGGVREWAWDLADDVPPTATSAPYASKDSLSVNAERYVLGGSYLSGADELKIDNYTHTNSKAQIGDVGFRCARSAK